MYTKGLHEIADGVFGYLQPDGGWGWSNAGLVTGDGVSLLVDTLYDLKLTAEMLDAMSGPTTGAPIETLVNTHANGDHTYGNQLVTGAEIVASQAAAEELTDVTPATMALLQAADFDDPAVASYVREAFGPFRYDNIELTPPTSVFSGERTFDVGGVEVRLVEVGPAHTAGDVLAFVPQHRTVFTGDILFIDGTPIMWAGPISNWVAACQRILDSDVDTIVPGHGPITDKAGVIQVQRYLEFIAAEARLRYNAGMDVVRAANDIELGEFAAWGESERIIANVDALFREFNPVHKSLGVVELFAGMAKYRADRR